MRIILPTDFHGEKYGCSYRLIMEDDADFIVKIRNNPKVHNYLHQTSADVELQREWIRCYKEREKQGEDYYFIYYYKGNPCGVNRIYNINEDGSFTSGSLVFDDNVPYEVVVAASLILKEIAYGELGLNYTDCSDGVHIDNKRVIKFSKMFGTVFTGRRETELGIFLTGGQKKEDFYRCAEKIKRLMGFE